MQKEEGTNCDKGPQEIRFRGNSAFGSEDWTQQIAGTGMYSDDDNGDI